MIFVNHFAIIQVIVVIGTGLNSAPNWEWSVSQAQFCFIETKAESRSEKKVAQFRSTPKVMSEDDVNAMLKKYDFFCKYFDWTKEYRNSAGHGFVNQFELQLINNEKVVLDHADNLMWQQTGSSDFMELEAAREWIDQLNQTGYAGFHDWRLPTLEEAMTLMETKVSKNRLYINPIFDATQKRIWTCDTFPVILWGWVVQFTFGFCSHNLSYETYVRAVRAITVDNSSKI